MLTEVKEVRQIEDEGPRRWFTDSYFDLILWYEEDGDIEGFQLCYDKTEDERALTWRRESGYSHERIDDGETPGRMKMTPVLVPDGTFDVNTIARRFREEAWDLDPLVSEFVYKKLLLFS